MPDFVILAYCQTEGPGVKILQNSSTAWPPFAVISKQYPIRTIRIVLKIQNPFQKSEVSFIWKNFFCLLYTSFINSLKARIIPLYKPQRINFDAAPCHKPTKKKTTRSAKANES